MMNVHETEKKVTGGSSAAMLIERVMALSAEEKQMVLAFLEELGKKIPSVP